MFVTVVSIFVHPLSPAFLCQISLLQSLLSCGLVPTLKNCWQQPLQQRNHQQRDDHCGAVGAKGTQENHQVPMLVHTYLDRFHFRESSRIFEAIIDVLQYTVISL